MERPVVKHDDVLIILETYESGIIVPEVISKRYGYLLGDVFRIVFNYRMAMKNYKDMTRYEIMKLLSEKVKTCKEERLN